MGMVHLTRGTPKEKKTKIINECEENCEREREAMPTETSFKLPAQFHLGDCHTPFMPTASPDK